MKSPGNFLIIDRETTKLFQMLAQLHPFGNKTVLKVLLKFYIKLAKHAKGKKVDPISLLENIIESALSKNFVGFELKKIKKIDQMVESVEGSQSDLETAAISEDLAELKMLIKQLRQSPGGPQMDEFQPKGAAELLKLEQDTKPEERIDYRQIRKEKRPRKIDF